MTKRRTDQPYRRLTPDKRREIYRLASKGLSHRDIAARVDQSATAVRMVVKPFGGVIRHELWEPGTRRLSFDERIDIKIGLELGMTLRAIARRIDRNPSTVCREVNANGGRARYTPYEAHEQAERRARRPKLTKLASNPELCARVVDDLKHLWSPQQIARRLKKEFADDAAMTVSHETIYKTLYVQGRGELRRELARCLRSGRAQRVARRRLHKPHIKDMVMISERPPEVEDRAVPGHWEGDLLYGRNAKSAIGTLVERSTRYVMLFSLPKGKSAEDVRDAMTKTIKTLPDSLKRTLTWDQGSEMAQHKRFSIDTGIDVYFCDPKSPWQRGSNENTNGLLRQYLPKGMSFKNVTEDELKAIADSLNGRPRQTLDWLKPAEKFAEFVATTG